MKEVWNDYLQKFEIIQEGGPGSGRYPAGSSDNYGKQGEGDGNPNVELSIDDLDKMSGGMLSGNATGAQAPITAKTLNADTFKSGINAPYVNASISTLGGEDRASLMFTVSADPKETWKNGYLENSRYIKGSIQHNGKVSVHSGRLGKDVPNMRAKTVKTFDEAVKYVNGYVSKYK